MRQEVPVAALPKHRPNLIPKRRALLVAVMLRWRRLYRAGRIGCRKAVDQTSLQSRVRFPVGRGGCVGVGGMLVVRRRIEFLSHVEPPWRDNACAIGAFPTAGTQCRPVRLPPPPGHGNGPKTPTGFFWRMTNIAQTGAASSARLRWR